MRNWNGRVDQQRLIDWAIGSGRLLVDAGADEAEDLVQVWQFAADAQDEADANRQTEHACQYTEGQIEWPSPRRGDEAGRSQHGDERV